MTRTYWLSFVDLGKPEGERFLGACVVDVTERDRKRVRKLAPFLDDHGDDAQWIATAVRKAHEQGCNPGGEVGTADISNAPDQVLRAYPRNRLLSKAEIQALP